MSQKKIDKFVVITTQRSGSNYFCFWLNNHPNIRCHSELFLNKYVGIDGFSYFCRSKFSRKYLSILFSNPVMKKLPGNLILSKLIDEYYNSLLYNPSHSGPITDNESLELRDKYHIREFPESDSTVGFKLMYDQLREYKALENILRKQSCKILHLIRNNVLKIYLSKITRRKRGIAHSANEVNQIKVYVNPSSLLKYIEKTIKITERMRNKFSNWDYLEVSYEEFIQDYEISRETIFDFLEVENTEVRRPVLKKLNPNSSKDIIQNYDEVSEALRNTPYLNFLD